MFEKPAKYDYHVANWFDDTPHQLMEVVQNYMLAKAGKTTKNL